MPRSPARPKTHEELMAASPAYRHHHTATTWATAPEVARTIAQGVAQQCNAWAPKLFHADLNRHAARNLLEAVVKELQELV